MHQSLTESVLKPNERIDFCMCNPPFYASKEAFQAENQRKIKGLAKGKKKVMPSDDETLSSNKAISTTKRVASNNFGGLESELWCTDGEVGFVKRIYMESKRYWNQCLWFTSLVSRKENLRKIERYIQKDKKKKNRGNKNRCVEMIQKQPMGAGRKSSTILMWTFLDETERQDWFKGRRMYLVRDSDHILAIQKVVSGEVDVYDAFRILHISTYECIQNYISEHINSQSAICRRLFCM